VRVKQRKLGSFGSCAQQCVHFWVNEEEIQLVPRNKTYLLWVRELVGEEEVLNVLESLRLLKNVSRKSGQTG